MSADVAILYRIITTAERDPNANTFPFRAIFAAYDKILAEDGLNPDHDQVYLRFLFKLGDKKRPGLSLYKGFEGLLEDLGIKIEFSSENFDDQDITRTFDEDGRFEAGRANDLRLRAGSISQGRSRRASFDSLPNAEEAITRESQSRSQSRASMSRLHIKEPTLELRRPSTRATTRATEKTKSVHSHYILTQPDRARLTAQEFASNLQHYQRRHASNQHRLPQSTTAKAAAARNRTSSAQNVPASIDLYRMEDLPESQARLVSQSPPLYQPSHTQLMRDVETFQHYRSRQVTRAFFEKWCGSAFRASREHESMQRLATSHDTGILLRSGFDQWRARCQRKKWAAETELFFDHQERKASKDRDVRLLTKAFTHWVECSSEAQMRKQQARKHFLEFKYFRAWLDLTTVNALKIRRQTLSRYFKIWKQRFAQTFAYDARALLFNNRKLARTAYWSWFWAFCDRRAPIWRENRIRKRFFSLWKSRQQQRLHSEELTMEERRYSLAKGVFSTWLARHRKISRGSEAAFAFYRSMLLNRALWTWNRRTRHAPRARQLSNMVDWRVAGTTFATIIARYRVQRQAGLVTHLRVLRNAWTTWNDHLRQRTLVRRIDDRVLVEALYRWVIAERHVLLARLHRQRIERRVFSTLVGLWSTQKEHRSNAGSIVERAVNRRCLASVVKHWRSKINSFHQNQRLSYEFQAPRITQEVLQSWRAKSRHLQEIQNWAKDAEFYFLATKLVQKRWYHAMIDAKRHKRRDAYAQLRRTVKMHLAARLFHQWRRMAANTIRLKDEACSHDQGRLLHLGSRLFDTWRIQAASRVEQGTQAEWHYEAHLSAQVLSLWSGLLGEQWRMADLAELNENLRIHSIASRWLHKLRLLVIELTRGPEANAQSLREFHKKRRLYNIFRRWQGNTAAISHRPVQTPASVSRPRRPAPLDVADLSEAVTAKPAERTALDKGFDSGEWIPALEKHTIVPPVKGYLKTPSKRAERAKALHGISTTPAGTPSQLRLLSHSVTEPRSARRDGLARPTTLRESAFLPIPEPSPRTPLRGRMPVITHESGF